MRLLVIVGFGGYMEMSCVFFVGVILIYYLFLKDILKYYVKWDIFYLFMEFCEKINYIELD